VVIAIISILATMLLPALKKARSYAKTIKCISNLHQIGRAAYLYQDDYGYACAYQIPIDSNNESYDWESKYRLGQYLSSFGGNKLAPLGCQSPGGTTAGKTDSPLMCPEVGQQETVGTDDGAPANKWISDGASWARNATIGINRFQFSTPLKLKNPKYRNPDRLMHFSDAFGFVVFTGNLSLTGKNYAQQIRLWHQNSAAIVYFDGHADARKRGSWTIPRNLKTGAVVSASVTIDKNCQMTPFWIGVSTVKEFVGDTPGTGVKDYWRVAD
jgi:prepilin-type processing-associated H-X9-DG protein